MNTRIPIIGGTPSAPSQAPGIMHGVPVIDPKKLLASATPSQLKVLMKDSFALWAQFSGLEVDGHKFDFDKHRYLLPLYLDNCQELVLIKAAQMGATVYMLLFLIWYARYYQVKTGLFFPTADGVTKLSKDRLASLLDSSQELKEAVSSEVDTLGLKQINNILGKKSSLYMLYLGGQASKDSVPLDIVCFDEVRLVNEVDIDQALERISHSTFKMRRFMSTAGMPHMDIHSRFLRGTQHTWHCKCNCSDGFVPSDDFPDCICDTGKEVYLRCPRCKMRINDPQLGSYIPHNPKAETHSYHISQLISKFISPKEIWEVYQKTSNKKEFFNAKLGRPYVDSDNQPITMDVLTNCINPDIKWAVDYAANPDIKRNCAMGVDQMGGYNYVVIARRGATGKKQLVHLEIIESSNPRYWENGGPVSPFKRLYELMKEYDVGLCVIDALPNYNEAADFARTFPGRIFLAHYGDAGVDIVKWHDKLKTREQIRKGSREIKLKWQVTMNRYMTLDYALAEFVERNVDIPHPDILVQTVRNFETGLYEAEPICRTRFFKMLTSLIRQQREIDSDTGRYKMEWVYTQGDPHFAHAWSYTNIAIERLKRASTVVFA